MARKPKALVLDSWAVLAYLGDEASAAQVADVIADAQEARIALCMSIVNLGEVWYILAREASEAQADQAVADLKQLGIAVVDADWRLARGAGRFKAKRRMSYADCFAAALAQERRAELVTGDREFRQVEREIAIRWV